MVELCFNTMNRSAYLMADADPDLPGQIAAAGAAGFRYIGPDAFSITRFVAEGGRVEALAESIEHAGLSTFELPTLMLNQDRATTNDAIERLATIAQILRPRFVQLNLDSEVDDSVVDALRRAGDRFGALGAHLAIEYLPWLPEVRDIRSTLAVLERANVKGAGVLVDTWHFTHGADSWDDLADLPLDLLAYVQFDDHPPLASDDLVDETVNRRVFPGEGVFELDRFCRVVLGKGFDGVVSCEILSRQTRQMPIETFARRVFDTSRRFWDVTV